MVVLIGSRAMQHAYPDCREPKDWDLIATRAELRALAQKGDHGLASLVPSRPGKYMARTHEGEQLEIEEVDECPSAALVHGLPGLDVMASPIGEVRVAPPTWLAAIKRSHVMLPIRWKKTISDLHWLRGQNGHDERDSPDIAAFVRLRTAEHVTRHGLKAARLAVTNEEFFARSQAAVGRIHDHDALHELVAYGDRPLYESFKRDLGRAALDRGMFLAAAPVARERLVREEAMAIALERFVIPSLVSDTPITAEDAYGRALQRICTTLTSGWFRDWAIDHWPMLNKPDVGFVRLYLESDLHDGRQVAVASPI